MNKKLKGVLEFLGILAVTVVIAMSSPLNPWVTNAFTQAQNEIFDIALQIRNGFLAYVEVDGHYGPVLYEFYGLGYLPTETHLLHFAMEAVLIFIIVLFQYKTAKLFTSEIFAFISAAVLTIFGWGALTHAGAEELMFFFLTLSVYHIARQLQSGFLSYHTYLLAIDLGMVFFLQPGYVFIWVVMILFFAVKFKIDGVKGKEYRQFWFSIFEGLLTVGVPMGLYLTYFRNAIEFWDKVVIYNMNNIGDFAGGLRVICGSPWVVLLPVLVVVIIIKVFKNEKIAPLCIWFCFMVLTFVVIALQGDNLDTFLQLSKAVYIVPIASVFSLIDPILGLKIEEREF
ncbi:hypothetical protein [Pseudobutyrivibrio sp.]|uniref:hypothetical protein n=1 Tax=Pseudobutyrivibrio sp. TaxID=2014367 RepID=UPI001E11D001|nr:hypothetical protein [Pseudobutyrivibrio sp.]MBE5911487.1 hypothetical protein [Pseudobutyrivibrio sp.]